jgi:hypothetical protein
MGRPTTSPADGAMTAAALRRRLDRLGLPAVLAAHRDSGQRPAGLRDARPALPGPLGTAVDLLCLHEDVAVGEAVAAVGADGVEVLVAGGLAVEAAGRLRMDEVRLVEHYGAMVFVGLPGAHRHGYYGADSVGLGRLLLGARGRCLDLFASTGAQSLVLARGGGEVVAIEIDEGLAPVLELNVDLNGAGRHVRAVWGDALEVPLDGEFDTVSINAPLVPTFDFRGLDRGADGGPTGRVLLEGALRRVRLRDGGRLVATATMLGPAGGPRVDWLHEVAVDRGLQFVVVPTGVGRLTGGGHFGRELAATLAGAAGQGVDEVLADLTVRWARDGVDAAWFCLVVGSPGTGDHPPVVVAGNGGHGRGWWV